MPDSAKATAVPRIAVRPHQAHAALTPATLHGGVRRRRAMPFYLTRFSYTPATWAKLIANPEDRRAAAKQYIEAVGGKLHGFWFAFGDHDAYNLWEAPDNVSMAATAIAISAGGALSSFETTVLMSVEDTLSALQKASAIRYRPPGEKQ
jgi:uncharacterized protein with GYD domain